MAFEEGADLDSESAIVNLLDETRVTVRGGKVFLNEVDVHQVERTPEIMQSVSKISQRPGPVEARIMGVMRNAVGKLACCGPVIVTGRGPYPGAFVNVFLLAPLEERVRRSIRARGEELNAEAIRRETDLITRRDSNDRVHRNVPGVIEIENDDVERVVATIIDTVDQRMEQYIVRSHKNRGSPVQEIDLNPYYDVNMPIRK